MQHLLLDRATGDEIEHEHFPLLADAVDTADALLDRHGVPWHVEIDEGVAELEIASLAPGFGGNQDRYLIPERSDRSVLVRAAEGSLEAGKANASVIQQVREMRHGLAIADEHDLLLGRIAAQEIEECRLLGALAERCPTFGK